MKQMYVNRKMPTSNKYVNQDQTDYTGLEAGQFV